VKTGEEHKVYKLSEALYRLRQGPRAWDTKLDGILENMKFQRCSQEQAVYKKVVNSSLILVGVYIDDLIVTRSNYNQIMKFKKAMSKSFEMSDLGKLTYYLGIEVFQDIGIVIKQEAYARKILSETKMENCNPTHTPMDPNLKLTKADEEDDVQPTEYRKIVGCLRYLLHTRPDLAFSVGVVSRYMQQPKTSHLAAIKQILRYIKGTMSYGTKYTRGRQGVIVG
jgi:hypothetical protein